jgi:uncharacterized protein (DUF58 family)
VPIPTALLVPLALTALGGAGAFLAALSLARAAERREQRAPGVGRPGRWLGSAVEHRGTSKELLQKVRRIHVKTGRKVDALLQGEYQSVFRGLGMEFEEVREYVPGDDVRSIDWNVTARMQRPFVKVHREERELVVMILVDVSPSGDFGTRGRRKNELAAELAATLAFAATRNHDKVGLLLFSDRVERFLPPKKGRGHVFRVIREVLDAHPEGRGTDLAQALSFLDRVVRKKAVVFVVSDFLDAPNFDVALSRVGRRHDLALFRVEDPGERELPDVGLLAVEDVETGGRSWVDTGDMGVRRFFARNAAEQARALETSLRKLGVDLVRIGTKDEVAAPLMRYFRARERRIR